LVLRLNQETITTGFEINLKKPSPPVLRSNRRNRRH
jgi:hypothetical protein